MFIEAGTDAGKSFTFNGTAWVQTDQASIDELGFIHDFIGKTGFGAETPTYSSTTVVTQSTDLESAIGELDAAAANSNVGTTLGAVSGTNTLDSVSAHWVDSRGPPRPNSARSSSAARRDSGSASCRAARPSRVSL